MVSFDMNTGVTLWFHLLFIHLCFLVFISSTQVTADNGCHEEETMALLNIKSSLYDPSNRLVSWGERGVQDEKNCCNWQGIRCSNDSFHVISIDLRNIQLENYKFEQEENNKIEQEESLILSKPPNTMLQGTISPSLSNITHLEYLDLGYNDFQESDIPFQFSVLSKLVHLDLSFSNILPSSPNKFTNLSSLRYLDLSCHGYFIGRTSCLQTSTIEWVGGLVNLRVLKLSGISLYEATTSGQESLDEHILYLSNLRVLDLSYCDIVSPTFLNQFHNLSRLSSLKMNQNVVSFSFLEKVLSNMTSLSILELSDCQLNGSFPYYLPQFVDLDVSGNFDLHLDITRMFKHQWSKLEKLWISYTKVTGPILRVISNAAPVLVNLDVSYCSIHGPLPSSLFSTLSQLQYLDLGSNSITGGIPSSISNLKHLHYLNLYSNDIQGSIPNSICEIFPLQKLVLDNNNISGKIPSCINKLQSLNLLSISNTSAEGNISLTSLINNSPSLIRLDLSLNMQLNVVIDQDLKIYPPNLMLKKLRLTSTNLKGSPTFICNLKGLVKLYMSRTNLTGTLPSCLFKLVHLDEIALSNNMLSGTLPLPPKDVTIFQDIILFDVSNNKLSGEISVETGERLSYVKIILLRGNELSGSIPFSIFPTETKLVSEFSLGTLDLSDNKLTGGIPTKIWRGSTLTSLKLGNNNLTGIVPKELELAKHLRVLLLNDNHLDGTIDFVTGLHKLEYLNLGNNNFGGGIPTALGSLQDLSVVSLRSNKLCGRIPEEIINLQKLCILDLSLNNLSGHIPTKLGNLSGLIISGSCHAFYGFGGSNNDQLTVLTKGNMVQVKKFYDYSSVVDLSCNALDGNIPEEIGLLEALSSLNLSHNQFSEDIPENIGNLSALESLDLSSNRLSGSIPQSLTTIDTLGVLNFSYNKLSGRIPRGNHFDTLGLDGSVFTGNDLLCGFPTEKLCKGDMSVGNSSNKVDEDDRDDAKEKLLLYAIVALGFGVGFWGLFLVLLLKKEKWWFPYWRFINFIVERITNYVRHH